MVLFKMLNKNGEKKRCPYWRRYPVVYFTFFSEIAWQGTVYDDAEFAQPWNEILFPHYEGSLILVELKCQRHYLVALSHVVTSSLIVGADWQ